MPRAIVAEDWPELLKPGLTAYMPGSAGESPLMTAALVARPQHAAGVTFTGVSIPGVNKTDYAGLDDAAQASVFFFTPEMRASIEAGRTRILPLSYHAGYLHLTRSDIDIAVLHLAPPDRNGQCSLGLAADFAPAVMNRARLRVGHVNPAMPHVADGPCIAFDTLDYIVEAEGPIIIYPDPSPDPKLQAIAAHIAALVEDGDTLEFGLGSAALAVAASLTGKRNLHIHSGMITDAVVDLAEAGALAPGCAVTTGVALGTGRLRAWVHDNAAVRFRSVAQTHDIHAIADIGRFTAINSAIEVDLRGNVNAETIAGERVSSIGGLADFMRGAALAPDGRAIIALKATAGQRSRIVPALPAASIGVSQRFVDYVVTEYGCANLRSLSEEARAEALMAVAAPAHRPALEAAWRLSRQ